MTSSDLAYPHGSLLSCPAPLQLESTPSGTERVLTADGWVTAKTKNGSKLVEEVAAEVSADKGLG